MLLNFIRFGLNFSNVLIKVFNLRTYHIPYFYHFCVNENICGHIVLLSFMEVPVYS